MKRLRFIFRIIFRFGVLWLVDVFSLWVTSLLIPGLEITPVENTPAIIVAVAAALLLGVVNLVVRPLILLLALPFGFFALFVVGFFVNAITLSITAALLPGFQVDSWLTAFFGGLLLSLFNTLITSFITIDDDDQFYQGLVERIAARQMFRHMPTSGRGLVMLEIDGLSYWHIQRAVEEGWMPTVKNMIEKQGYRLTRFDCGLPSQTSAAQAGILFGDNYDIPGFRWYDKSQGKLIVSGRDAAMLNQRFANGKGLLRGGSSINNMLSGDAEKSLLTLANLSGGDAVENRRRAQDMYLLLLNPYFFMRILFLFTGEVLLEIFQYLKTRLKGEWPRLNRLAHFYPLLRASATVFMREVATYLVVLDIIRGSPSIYMTWPGYDEVAHHSGPWSKDAFGVLRKFDRVIDRVLDIINRKAPIPYELILLSDHGQSTGATFSQRYGESLEEYIDKLTPADVDVMLSSGGDDSTLGVRALNAEIENIRQQGVAGRVGTRVARQTQRVITKGAARQQSEDERPPKGVIVCGSGNMAQVYFDLLPRKLTLVELEAAYPGLIRGLLAHEGVGFIVGYDAGFTPILLGKAGSRNLHTGEVQGEDPLAPYGDPELRAEQVRRVADFPNAGDLMVNSTLYPDGTVAAMEELIGNHGGLGGEQTDAFLLHPPDMHVPPTRNATDIYRVLNDRRAHPLLVTRKPQTGGTPRVDEWSLAALRDGLGRYETWLTLASHCLWLSRDAYRAVVEDPYMTSPALAILLATSLVVSFLGNPENFFSTLIFRVALFPLPVLVMHAAGRVLGGKGTYTQTLRAVGFAQMGNFIQLVELFSSLAPVARPAAFALTLFGTWFGMIEAHRLRGWRVWVIPLMVLVVLVGGIAALGVLVSGAAYTFSALLGDWLGIPPG
jgi:uncharacterized membrane protein YvlD (DUF360 family)